MLIVDGGLEQEAFGDWKGKKNEMKNAAAELLRSDMQAEKLKSLYEKACKNQPVGGGESVMIDCGFVDARLIARFNGDLYTPCHAR